MNDPSSPLDLRAAVPPGGAALERRRFQALVQATSDVVYRMNPDWTEMRQLTGGALLADTLVPRADWMEAYLFPEDRERVTTAIRCAIARRGVFQLEHRVIRPDGRVGWVHSRAVPLLDGDGTILEWFGAATDTTARHEAEEAVSQLRAREAYLLELSDALQSRHDPVEIQEVASRLLVRHLAGTRAYYVVVDEDSGTATIARVAATRSDQPSLVGRHRLEDYAGPVAQLRSGRPLVLADIAADASMPLETRARYLGLGVAATVSWPLVRDGRLVAVLAVDDHMPHAWSEAEIALGEETASRTWAAVERAMAEHALRASEARYRWLFESMEEGFMVADVLREPDGTVADLRYVELNGSFERLTGLIRDEVLGRRRGDLLGAHDRHLLGIVQRVVDTGIFERFEHEIPALGRWYDLTIYPQGLDRVAALYDDITARKRAESASRENERQLRAIADLVPDLLWSNDADGRMLWVNRRWVEYSGLSADALRADQAGDLVHPDDRARVMSAWNHAIATGEHFASEHRLRAADGAYRWHLVRCERLEPERGRDALWFGAATEVHEHRMAREELERLVADRTQELRTLLAGTERLQDDERRRIARELHDSLGQHITSLDLTLRNLGAGVKDEVVREGLDTLQRLLQGIDKELDRIVFLLRPTALEDCGLGEAVASFASTWSELSGVPVDLAMHGLEHAASRLPGPIESAVFRVVQEALVNVSKHARASRVGVTLDRRKRQLAATVEDDGVGFDPADFLAGNTGRLHWGLVGMRERVEALGGTFAIESRPGEGTTLLLRVPPFRRQSSPTSVTGIHPRRLFRNAISSARARSPTPITRSASTPDSIAAARPTPGSSPHSSGGVHQRPSSFSATVPRVNSVSSWSSLNSSVSNTSGSDGEYAS